jgi:actin-related protein
LKPGDHKNLLDFEFFELLKETLENKMMISPSDFKVIVNTSPIRNSENIIRLSKLFIEDLNFKALAIVNSSSLSLFSTGRTSGLVVECGESRSYIVPVYEGFPLYHALNKNRIGGKDLTYVLSEGINQAGINLSSDDLINLRKIKEKTLSVPYSKKFEDYMNSNDDIIPPEKRLYKILSDEIAPEKKSYKLPDEQMIIDIPKSSRLLASELLFNPSILGRQDKGLVALIADSIKKTVVDNDELKKVKYFFIQF